MFRKITIIWVITMLFSGYAYSERMASLKKPLKIDSDNFKAHSYEISLDSPQKKKSALKRFEIKHPKEVDGYSYAYSKALYSENGKILLSYRPQSFSLNIHKKGTYHIVGDKRVIECLSLVDVYHKKGVYGLHPPQKSIEVNLSSFIINQNVCNGKLSAVHFY